MNVNQVFWFVLALTLPGCGQRLQLGQVEGTVRAGGKPLVNVVIVFVPDTGSEGPSIRSMAQADAQGHYRLQTESQQDGAVVGKHRVTIEDLAILKAPRTPDGTVISRPPARFPADYSDPLRSPLIREIKPGTQTINLDLPAGP